MKINVKQTENKINFEVTPKQSDWKNELEKTRINLSKNIKVEGFRKGKVPLEIAKKYISDADVISRAVNSIAEKTKKELENSKEFTAIKKTILPFIDIDVKEVNLDNLILAYEYTEYPKVELGDYKSIKIKKPSFDVSEEELQKEIAKELKRFSVEEEKKEGTLEEGNIAVFNFTGYKDGEPFAGGSAQNYELEIGSKQFIEGFENKMIGMKLNEERELDLIFPEDYNSQDLAGKSVVFKVKLNGIKENKIPELTDEFVKKMENKNFSNVQEYKEFLKNTMMRVKENEFKQNSYNQVIKSLKDISKISHFDERQIQQEMKLTKDQQINELKQRGIKLEQYFQIMNISADQYEEQLREQVKDAIVVSLAIEKIAENENISPTEKDRIEFINKMVSIYGGNPDEIRKQVGDNTERMDDIIIRDKVLEFLINQK